MMRNRPFSRCFKPHCESEAKWKIFILKINLFIFKQLIFRMKSFALKTRFHNEIHSNYCVQLFVKLRFGIGPANQLYPSDN